MHPSVRLLLWVCLVVVGQTLEGWPLAGALAGSLVPAVAMAPAHLRRLLRRARFLLLTIGLLFACGTPGEGLVAWLGAASPTAEGLTLAATHGGRLLLVLAMLALLLERTPSATLVAGVYGLLRPFRHLRVPRERVALRLLLVLRYAEEQKGHGRRRSWRQWLDWLECHDGEEEGGDAIALHAASLGLPDYALLLILAAGVASYLAIF